VRTISPLANASTGEAIMRTAGRKPGTAGETEMQTQMAKATPTLSQGMEAVARNLREFGYSDVTAAMIRHVYDAWLSGNRYPDLPHGIIGGFAEKQFEENGEMLAKLIGDKP
jgi:hypothetical protein